jgi:hypothetical protein
MLSNFLKLFLVSTALAPIFFSLAFLSYRDGDALAAGLYLGVTVALTAGCVALLRGAKKKLEVLPFSITSATTADREVIGFLLAYVMPLVLSQTGAVTLDGWTITFLVVLFAGVVWGTHSYDFNPVLGILGYHFYEVQTQGGINYVLITRRKIVSVREITKVVHLTEYVVMDHS